MNVIFVGSKLKLPLTVQKKLQSFFSQNRKRRKMGCEKVLKSYRTPWLLVLIGLSWQYILMSALASNSAATSINQNNPSNEKDDFEDNKVEEISTDTKSAESDSLISKESRFDIVKKWSQRISKHRYYQRFKIFFVSYEVVSMIIVAVTDMIAFANYLNGNKDLSGWTHYQCYSQILLSSSNGKRLMLYNLRNIAGGPIFAKGKSPLSNFIFVKGKSLLYNFIFLLVMDLYASVLFTHVLPGIIIYGFVFACACGVSAVILLECLCVKKIPFAENLYSLVAVVMVSFASVFSALIIAEFYSGTNWWTSIEVVWNRRTWNNYTENLQIQAHSFLQFFTMLF
ncbi:hypothetical protein RFI_19002 [Reticulomyxa filosa]|uniref:Uncharacterized protein n=1 Tax=Reticulomyxa filosa TaxID=46433 RepID=X6MXB7_RETFI|nr:hypothetical protein RFI_19002 [Reticulomyxa filosa]|eukprot:ETO18271.1 hypothetical protein RFI_19002 [Reticulomyxa filosa]